jgi:hypothetical protein
MPDSRIKILYIAGWGRSGSTLLGNILGSVDGFVHVGEIRRIWDDLTRPNAHCGCGRRLRACGAWRTIFTEAFGGFDEVDYREMWRRRETFTRIRAFPRAYLWPRGWSLGARFEEFLSCSETLYRAVRDVTGRRVIVDSSKLPSYAYALARSPHVDLYVLHLVRDSRAVAYSWQRKKLQPEWGFDFRRLRPETSSMQWTAWSVVAELLGTKVPGRYLRLRYEDFVERPPETIRRVLRFAQETVRPLPFTTEHLVEIAINHTAAGNPNRFDTGPVELRLDGEWSAGMRSGDKAIVTALTWPWLLRYGYSLWRPRA